MHDFQVCRDIRAMFLKGRFYAFLFCMASLFLLTANLQAAMIHVPSDYKTIHESVEHASPGDTVMVGEGTYRENILITKPLTIKSEKGSENTIVQAAVRKEPVFKVLNVDGAAITGFTATGSDTAGIYIRNSRNILITDNKTLKNDSGLRIYNTRNSLFRHNTANANEQFGIYLEASGENTIEKNTVESNKDKGIYLNASHNNSVQENSVKLNIWNGIILWLSNNNTVKDNTVFRNMYGIVIAESKDTALINNTNWPNIYLILPVVLAYLALILFFIEQKIFSLLEK